ncbi:unnamed protein product [Rhizophagus irregularis]|nr:unnamed protein product [Rhizophagus irregularis]
MYTKNEGNKERPYNFRKYTKQYEENLVNELTIIISPSESQVENQNKSPNASSIIIIGTTKTVHFPEYDDSGIFIEDFLTVV